jgi:hypothetical protein
VGVVAVLADPSVADGQFWPTPSPGACTTGATRGRGGRAGMPSFGAISIASAMVLECFFYGGGVLHVEPYVKPVQRLRK